MFFLFLGAREPFESPELERFAHALDIVQRRCPNLTIGQLSTLLRVGMVPAAEGQFVSVSDIVEHSPGQKYPTIARQLDQLGNGTAKSPGLGLIEKDVDPEDRRNRWVGISERGKLLLYELDLILAPDIVTTIGQPRPEKAEGQE
jgi:DNA-binding MarR family transcriptional regulator